MYKFFGWDSADVKPADPAFSVIENQRNMYELLSGCWSAETCAPRMRSRWCAENKTLGQCSITAFLVQDVFGGEVYGVPLSDGNYHCYNVVKGSLFDLTSEQFGDEKLEYKCENPQFREVHFAKQEKKERYELLKARLEAKLR